MMSEDLWFYSQGGEQRGPLSFSELSQKAASGQLQPDELVWREGMPSWEAARRIPELLPETQAGPGPRSPIPPMPPPSAGTPAPPLLDRGRAFFREAAGRTRSLPESGEEAARRWPHLRLVAGVLEALEGALTTPRLDAVDGLAKRLGHLGYVLATILFLLFYTALAIKADTVKLFLQAFVVIIPVALVGHYTAVMFLEAGTQLLPKLPSRLFSRAFLRCTALILLAAALARFGNGVYLLIESGAWPGFGVACVWSAILLYLAGLALHPEGLEITVDEEGTASEEASGILVFVLKMLLRLAPVVFGVGTLAGTGAATYFLIQLSRDEIVSIQFPVAGSMTILDISGWVLGLGFFPLAAYLVFVFSHFLLSVFQAVLAVPPRLDALKSAAKEG